MCSPCVSSQSIPPVPHAGTACLPPARRAPRRLPRGARRAGAGLLALAGGLAGLLGLLPASPVAAHPFPVTVRLSIERVTALTPSDFGDCNDAGADFYALVQVNRGVTVRFRPVPNNDDITPTWKVAAPVAPAAVAIPIVVEVLDDDSDCSIFSDPPDLADISPVSGTHRLELTVTLGDIPCTVTAAGNGDPNGDVQITFRVEAFPNLPDSDADGLPDDWEQNGVTLNGQFMNLPAMGADKTIPDIFVHLDWLEGADPTSPGSYHDERLSLAVLQEVVDAFANSPHQSPTGSLGITLHIDHGPTNSINMGSDTNTSARSWPWMPVLIPLDSTDTADWTSFEQLKTLGSFVALGRSPIFHYAIAAPKGGVEDASGISRGIPSSDFVVAQGQYETPALQAKTLMHELGHNLGLGHGGDEDVNYKPNYISIMNYLFAAGVDAAGTLDYSGAELPLLDEGHLEQTPGLGPDAAGLLSYHLCTPASATPPTILPIATTDIAAGPIDWDCDGVGEATEAPFDVNGDSACVTPGPDGLLNTLPAEDDDFDASGMIILHGPDRICDTYAAADDTQEAKVGTRHPAALQGFNDWEALQFEGGAIGALDTGALPLITPSEPPLPAPHGVDLALLHSHFYLGYTVNNSTTPDIVIPPTAPGVFPFNTADQPFELPCAVQNLGGQLRAQVVSAATPVYWKGTVRFLQADGTVIVSQGFSGVHSFAQGAFPVTPPVAPGLSADAGYTPLSTINAFCDWMYQPADLGENTPVRMELRVTPFADAQHRQLLEDSDPENNVVNIWVMRACSN